MTQHFKTRSVGFSVLFGVAAVIGAGCNKSESTTPAAGQASSGAVAGTAASTAVSVTTLAGTYHAVSSVDGDPGARRDQTLILNPDMTVELTTTVVNPGKPVSSMTDKTMGTYVAAPKEVVATFTTKDGKAIPASDAMRTLKLTREPGDKSLLADGRTYKKAQ